MRRRVLSVLLALFILVGGGRAAVAQASPAPLQAFVADVARLWAAGDADALVDLAPADGRIVLDVGGGSAGPVGQRQAAAALRAVFGGRTTVSVRAERSTVSGGSPVSGFGELRWDSRLRGVSTAHASVVFVGVVWDGRAWRVRELRILD
ncbi:MAG: hypothetical protein JWM27_62 [Gemmatimonadetes bacterium]|nr:hypothetical protein [Gemmatimonadota bacterium]